MKREHAECSELGPAGFKCRCGCCQPAPGCERRKWRRRVRRRRKAAWRKRLAEEDSA